MKILTLLPGDSYETVLLVSPSGGAGASSILSIRMMSGKLQDTVGMTGVVLDGDIMLDFLESKFAKTTNSVYLLGQRDYFSVPKGVRYCAYWCHAEMHFVYVAFQMFLSITNPSASKNANILATMYCKDRRAHV